MGKDGVGGEESIRIEMRAIVREDGIVGCDAGRCPFEEIRRKKRLGRLVGGGHSLIVVVSPSQSINNAMD